MIEKADLQNKTALHIDIKTSISCFILIYGQYQVISHPTTLSLQESRNQLDHLMTTADRYTLQEMIFTIKPPGEV
ncbi:hypothetical protein NC651_017383 [Populus alba x Populus x berolinensis]|nr:hypothetical protein NC651_017383 [Populus alba x Populus x berolinensis]